jgi:hypothetical protein
MQQAMLYVDCRKSTACRYSQKRHKPIGTMLILQQHARAGSVAFCSKDAQSRAYGIPTATLHRIDMTMFSIRSSGHTGFPPAEGR